MSTDMPLAPFVQQGPELHDAHWLLGAGELITIRVPRRPPAATSH